MSRKFTRVFGWVFTMLGVVALVVVCFLVYKNIVFGLSAISIEGTVTDVTIVYPQTSGTHNTAGPAYYPTIQFTANDGQTYTIASNTSSTGPAYYKGESVKILYSPSNPNDGIIDSFSQRWFIDLIIFFVAFVFSLLGYACIRISGGSRHKKWLLQNGTAVNSEFQRVENGNLSNVEIDRSRIMRPQGIREQTTYKIISQWVDPATSQVHVFRSENIWFDPTDYIKDRNIKVYIDPQKPSRYYVDTSFLPKEG